MLLTQAVPHRRLCLDTVWSQQTSSSAASTGLGVVVLPSTVSDVFCRARAWRLTQPLAKFRPEAFTASQAVGERAHQAQAESGSEMTIDCIICDGSAMMLPTEGVFRNAECAAERRSFARAYAALYDYRTVRLRAYALRYVSLESRGDAPPDGAEAVNSASDITNFTIYFRFSIPFSRYSARNLARNSPTLHALRCAGLYLTHPADSLCS